MSKLVRCTQEKCAECVYFVGKIESPDMRYCEYLEIEGSSRIMGKNGRPRYDYDLCDKFTFNSDLGKKKKKRNITIKKGKK